jgi:Cu/Ag efflux protein CusF
MKKLLTATAAVAFLGVSSIAALAHEVTGSMTDIDVAFGTITLDNGQTYRVAPEQKMELHASNATPAVLASFKVGDKVVIRFELFGGELAASSVAPAAR